MTARTVSKLRNAVRLLAEMDRHHDQLDRWLHEWASA